MSKDRDFESVVKNIRAAGVHCEQVTTVERIQPPGVEGADSNLLKVVRYLENPKSGKPCKATTLRGSIKNLVPGIDNARLEALVEELKRRGIVTEEGGKVTYC